MSDQRLRELERRWRENGTDSDQAAWLLERVRAGLLTDDRLALAAYAEHPAARLALEGQPPTRAGLSAWVRGLRRLEGEGLRDAAVRLVALVLLCEVGVEQLANVEGSGELLLRLQREWEFPQVDLRGAVESLLASLQPELELDWEGLIDTFFDLFEDEESQVEFEERDLLRLRLASCQVLLRSVVAAEQRSTLASRVASALSGFPDVERAQAEVKGTVARWALGGPAFPPSG